MIYRPLRPFEKLFESPVGSGGNDGVLPPTYDPQWQFFRNLTPNQIAWFQAQPDWLVFYASTSGWHKEINGITVDGVSVETDAHSAAILYGHDVQASIDPASTTYITRHGRAITAAQATTMATALNSHIQNCRTVTKQIITGIKSNKIKSMEDISTALAKINTDIKS